MKRFGLTIERESLFQLRPTLLIICLSILLMLLLPDALRGHRTAKWLLLVFGSIAVILGWLFSLTDQVTNNKWRQFITLITAVYLGLSIPAFFFEFSPFKWFLKAHSWPSIYVRPWVHWGFIFVYVSVVGSLFARGRTRIAFAAGSILLMILWQSMPRWVY